MACLVCRLFKVCTLVATLSILIVLSSAQNNTVPFGSCAPGEESCTKCYFALKQSLLSKDENVRNLSLAFYPPRASNPEFVTVTYKFDNGSFPSQLWFWTHDSSYLFFPLRTFQYLSLFFGKLEYQVSQNVSLTLDAECYINDTTNPNMILLTQRLKDFVERKKYNPEINGNYFAKAEQYSDDILSRAIAIYIITFYASGFVCILLVSVILLSIYFCSKRWDKKLRKLSPSNKRNKYSRAKIFGVSVTGFIINIYMMSLDIVAIRTVTDDDSIVPEKRLISLPYIVFGIGGAMFVVSGVFWLLTFIRKKTRFCFMALTTLGPTYTLIIHLPYIMIAFLNDAYHASSVFIFYTIVAFVLFGALELTYGTYQTLLINAENGKHRIDTMALSARDRVRMLYNGQEVRCEPTFHFPRGTRLKTEFLKVKEQTLDIGSIVLQAEDYNRFKAHYNEHITGLTIQFVQNEANGEANQDDDHLLSTSIPCSFKSVTDDEELRVVIEVPLDTELQVDEVDENSCTITFQGEHRSLNVNKGEMVMQGISATCLKSIKTKIGIKAIFYATIPIFIALLLALIALVTAVLVLIPINNAFSDAPNRLIGFYQSVVIVVGAYLVYKNFFKKNPSIENVVQDRETRLSSESIPEDDDDWQHLSKDERVTKFYSKVVDMVANHGDLNQLKLHLSNIEQHLKK